MVVIGLTGSIGMGKSTTADMLRAMKIPVHCADKAVHKLLADGGAGVEEVLEHFPEARGHDGGIDRRKLRDVLGKDNKKWDLLETILHPLVQEAQQEFMRQQTALGVKVVALDVPLLFETGGESRVDHTICVSAPAFIQKQRVTARPGATIEDFEFRLARQMSDEDKRRKADFILSTGTSIADTRRDLQEIVRTIKADMKNGVKKNSKPDPRNNGPRP